MSEAATGSAAASVRSRTTEAAGSSRHSGAVTGEALNGEAVAGSAMTSEATTSEAHHGDAIARSAAGGVGTGEAADGLVVGTGDVAHGLVVGTDGRARCAWGASTPDYAAYHDTEWGRVVRGDVALYERLTLEAFQSGLSWLTILRKREGFRAAFAGFDPDVVAAFGDDDVARLLADPGIVRNRTKVLAAVANARALVRLREERGEGALDALVWSFAPEHRPRPSSPAEVPATTPESVALAKALKRAGFVFVGPTTAYAGMQACGLVDDHLAGCFVPPAR